MKRGLGVACLFLACSTAWAQDAVVIYKYRGPDGRMHYSDKPIRGAELIEAFEYTPPPPAPARAPSKNDAEGELRIKKHLSALEAAWQEVQASGRALAEATARRDAGADPVGGEVSGIVGPSNAAPPSAGGPMAPAPQSGGGPNPVTAPPSAGGPEGARRGGRVNREYVERQARLEAEVEAARKRNQLAWEQYNKLR